MQSRLRAEALAQRALRCTSAYVLPVFRPGPDARDTSPSVQCVAMDTNLATEIARIEAALRNTLDDIHLRTAAGAGREHTRTLVTHARALAERLQRSVDRLDDDDDAEGMRRMAAYLAAHLTVLEREDAPPAFH